MMSHIFGLIDKLSVLQIVDFVLGGLLKTKYSILDYSGIFCIFAVLWIRNYIKRGTVSSAKC